jgi:sortase A
VSDSTPATGTRRPLRRWELFLGVVGRVLIATGLLLLAFVGYQLWGTGIEQAQRQNRLNNEFEALLSAVAPSTTTTTVGPPPSSGPAVGGVSTTTTLTSTPATTVAPTLVFDPDLGDPVARLEIPRLSLSQIVVMGVRTSELKTGPGHFPDTPLPGQVGNAAIAGHRTSYGAPFGDLDRLDPGDELVLTTPVGSFRYLVTGSEVVDPSAVYVLDPRDPQRAELTLVTCHPRYSVNQRLIVYATLDATVTPAPPTPTTAAPRPQVVGSVPVTLPGDALSPTDPTGEADDGALGEGFDEVDPFAAGWFADDAAWWHVAAWGLALTVIALAATGVGRARNQQRLTAVVAIGPFLVVLYFFFQNVNRLLPPGL